MRSTTMMSVALVVALLVAIIGLTTGCGGSGGGPSPNNLFPTVGVLWDVAGLADGAKVYSPDRAAYAEYKKASADAADNGTVTIFNADGTMLSDGGVEIRTWQTLLSMAVSDPILLSSVPQRYLLIHVWNKTNYGEYGDLKVRSMHLAIGTVVGEGARERYLAANFVSGGQEVVVTIDGVEVLHRYPSPTFLD